MHTCTSCLPEAVTDNSVSESPSDDPTLSAILGMTLDDLQEEMVDAGIKGSVTTLVAKARAALLENVRIFLPCMYLVTIDIDALVH